MKGGNCMKISNRAYDEKCNDFKKMWDFLINDYSYRKDEFIWTLGRITDWKYNLSKEKKYVPSFQRKNAQLWLNGFDELVGFAISEDGDNMFFIFTRPGYEHLYNAILNWVMNNWNNRDRVLVTEIHEFQKGAMEILENNGFNKKGPVATTRKYSLIDKVNDEFILEPGFSVVDMVVNQDYKSKRLLQRNAFRNVNVVTELDLITYEYDREESPIYNPFYDLSVIDINGVHAAGCIAFVDYENKYAEIERVCTHSGYRRKGLAEAVIRECFKRLRSEGIEFAYITGYSEKANGLYEKLGPVTHRNWFHYELSY